MSPFGILPGGPSVEVNDLDGDLLIPADLLDDFAQPGPTPTPVATEDTPPGPHGEEPGHGGGHDAAAPARDASARDAGSDGGPLSTSEAGAVAVETDAGGIAYADEDASAGDGGFGRDPGSLIGGLGNVSAGPNNVTVLINFEVIRGHPLGPRIQPILAAIPEWKQFMTGSSIDPYRDTDWMLITGPSLLDTSKDAIFMHYSTSDAEVDKAIGAVAAQYAKGGPMDVGVPGVKVTRFFAHGAERAFIRPRSHLVLIVPSSHAKAFAQAASKSPLTPRFRRGEAVSMRALRPGGSVNVIPQSISALDMWIVPRNGDGGGDLYAEGACPDAASATQAADDLKNTVAQKNSLGVKIVTGGLLSGFESRADGATVKVHLPATKEQIETLIGLAGMQVGVAPPPKN